MEYKIQHLSIFLGYELKSHILDLQRIYLFFLKKNQSFPFHIPSLHDKQTEYEAVKMDVSISRCLPFLQKHQI